MAGTIFLKPFCLPAGALRENLKWQFANWMLSLGKFGSVFFFNRAAIFSIPLVITFQKKSSLKTNAIDYHVFGTRTRPNKWKEA